MKRKGMIRFLAILTVLAMITTLGTAFAAAIGAGLAKLEDATALFEAKTRYTPKMDAVKRQELLGEWHRAIEHAKGWHKTN